jgi:hypothetical protein
LILCSAQTKVELGLGAGDLEIDIDDLQLLQRVELAIQLPQLLSCGFHVVCINHFFLSSCCPWLLGSLAIAMLRRYQLFASRFLYWRCACARGLALRSGLLVRPASAAAGLGNVWATLCGD